MHGRPSSFAWWTARPTTAWWPAWKPSKLPSAMTPPRKGSVMRSWPSRRIMPARLSIRARGERVLRLVSFRGALACRHRHDARAQDADRVAAHRGADFVIGEAGVDQRLRHLHEVRGVEAQGGGAVIVRSEERPEGKGGVSTCRSRLSPMI